jgi:predicted DNA-binding protein YlxM (UPF0122 family)
MPAKVITAQIDERIRELAEEDKTMTVIAKMTGLKYQTVYDHVNRNNIKVRPEPRGQHNRKDKPKERIVSEDYFDENARENWLM